MSIALFVVWGILCTLAAVILGIAFLFGAHEPVIVWALGTSIVLAVIFWVVAVYAFKNLASM